MSRRGMHLSNRATDQNGGDSLPIKYGCPFLRRRLLEYEQVKLAAHKLNRVPQFGRDFLRVQIHVEQFLQPRFPDVTVADLQDAWRDIVKRARLVQHHFISREGLSVREHMST